VPSSTSRPNGTPRRLDENVTVGSARLRAASRRGAISQRRDAASTAGASEQIACNARPIHNASSRRIKAFDRSQPQMASVFRTEWQDRRAVKNRAPRRHDPFMELT